MTGIDRLEALGIAVLAGVVFAGCGQAAPAGGSAAPATARPGPAPPPARIDYMAIKADKAALEAAGRYEGEARAEIARRFGRLLSYPEKTIAEMLARREP